MPNSVVEKIEAQRALYAEEYLKESGDGSVKNSHSVPTPSSSSLAVRKEHCWRWGRYPRIDPIGYEHYRHPIKPNGADRAFNFYYDNVVTPEKDLQTEAQHRKQ
jgi:hypothetical protein